MWRVDQTDLTQTSGNCFQACLASILERDLETIPHFMACPPTENWYANFDRWLTEQGLFSVECRLDKEASIIVPGEYLCIISGPSPRFADTYHAVVGRTREFAVPELELIHDPYYPTRNFFDGKPPTSVTFIGRRNLAG